MRGFQDKGLTNKKIDPATRRRYKHPGERGLGRKTGDETKRYLGEGNSDRAAGPAGQKSLTSDYAKAEPENVCRALKERGKTPTDGGHISKTDPVSLRKEGHDTRANQQQEHQHNRPRPSRNWRTDEVSAHW